MVWPSGMGGAAKGGAGNVRGGVGTGETAEISLTALSAMKLWSAMSLPKRSTGGSGGGGSAVRGSASGGRSNGSGEGIGARDISGGGGGGVSGSPAPVSTAPGGGVVVTSTYSRSAGGGAAKTASWAVIPAEDRSNLCGNQISGAPSHRRDVVPVTASAQWRVELTPSTRGCLHSCVCSMAVRLANVSDNLTHSLISTHRVQQVRRRRICGGWCIGRRREDVGLRRLRRRLAREDR